MKDSDPTVPQPTPAALRETRSCEVIVHWAKAEADIGFCGTAATHRYPALGGGYMHLCDEHAIPHLNYAEPIHAND